MAKYCQTQGKRQNTKIISSAMQDRAKSSPGACSKQMIRCVFPLLVLIQRIHGETAADRGMRPAMREVRNPTKRRTVFTPSCDIQQKVRIQPPHREAWGPPPAIPPACNPPWCRQVPVQVPAQVPAQVPGHVPAQVWGAARPCASYKMVIRWS